MEPLLDIRALEIGFPAEGGAGFLALVRGASLAVARREIVGLVGESGSGKSLTALATLGLVPVPGRITAGSVRLDGRELVGLPERELRAIRGARIGLVFQEPSAALNPVLTVGAQIVEAIRAHQTVPRTDARRRALDLLHRLSIPDPARRFGEYSHQLSGGQRQRVVLALALAAGPDLLIADEPTTALDVTLQAEVLDLLVELRAEMGLAVLLISHDLGVVAQVCDRIAVMYAGEIVEEGSVARVFARPLHPYTRGLLAVLPRLGSPAPRGALPTISGQVPAMAELPAGCAFHPRCPERLSECSTLRPRWFAHGQGGARCLARERDAGGPG